MLSAVLALAILGAAVVLAEGSSSKSGKSRENNPVPVRVRATSNRIERRRVR